MHDPAFRRDRLNDQALVRWFCALLGAAAALLFVQILLVVA